jgi:hypothetical protein
VKIRLAIAVASIETKTVRRKQSPIDLGFFHFSHEHAAFGSEREFFSVTAKESRVHCNNARRMQIGIILLHVDAAKAGQLLVLS